MDDIADKADSAGENNKKYELTPEDATSFENEGAGFFNRQKVIRVLCIAFAVIICGGLLLNINRKKNAKDDSNTSRAARAPAEFLNRERNRAGYKDNSEIIPAAYTEKTEVFENNDKKVTLPEIKAYNEKTERAADAPPRTGGDSGSGNSGGGSGGSGGGNDRFSAHRSPLAPPLEGGFFSGAAQNARQGAYADQSPYMAAQAQTPYPATMTSLNGPQADYITQNNQTDKKDFYNSGSTGGALSNGYFLGDNALWPGVIIPAVLETAINTDLPGNVIARVTQNIYDSRTGNRLLIPQGTVLVAKYNSSVSYAQHRVQIVWDALIRPDGFYLELEGMNGVDKKGMSGQAAKYSENWFEYLKAAGIITMFSIATSKMAEEASKYADNNTAAGIVQGNAEFLNTVGGNIVGKAMNRHSPWKTAKL